MTNFFLESFRFFSSLVKVCILVKRIFFSHKNFLLVTYLLTPRTLLIYKLVFHLKQMFSSSHFFWEKANENILSFLFNSFILFLCLFRNKKVKINTKNCWSMDVSDDYVQQAIKMYHFNHKSSCDCHNKHSYFH